MQAQGRATIEHCLADEPVIQPEGISVNELDVVLERHRVFVVLYEDTFYLIQ